MGELINGRTREAVSLLVEAGDKIGAGLHSDNPEEREIAKIADALIDVSACLARKLPKWIGVEERLPEHEHEVLVYTDRYGGRTEFAYYVRHLEAWYQNCCLLIPNVTHWMPMPEPPKEGE